MNGAKKGPAFLLKLQDDAPRSFHATTPFYSTAAGMRITRMLIEDKVAEIDAEGIFLGSSAESKVRGYALSGDVADYELSFEGGEKIRGKFAIHRLDYSGDFNGERNYRISLKSQGPVLNA